MSVIDFVIIIVGFAAILGAFFNTEKLCFSESQMKKLNLHGN